jgi:branched-chain amino acid transport system ATP-binding protein
MRNYNLAKNSNAILLTENVSKYFGKMAAVKDLSFQVNEGEIFGIAGPNGAGKTTLFNVISHVFPPDDGRIKFQDMYIHTSSLDKIYRLGIARTFQIPALFKSLSVRQNVQVGATFGNPGKVKKFNKKEIDNLVYETLKFTGLLKIEDVIAEELSLMDRKLLMIASALVTKPLILMLDEPIAGLGKVDSDRVMGIIRDINDQGVTVLLIEHVMEALMGLSKRVMIMHHGEKICEGKPDKVAKDEKVIEAYLGEEYQRKKSR